MSDDGQHNGEFSIVRHKLLDDEKFGEVYGDDAALATWLRLLIQADKSWPSPAAIPRGVEDEPLALLVRVELIDLLPHDEYVVHGMAAEREQRAARFKKAVQAREQRRQGSPQ